MEKISVDFNNCDAMGRVRLNTKGTFEDLDRLNFKLEQGLKLLLVDDDELKAIGIVEFSQEENIWVASFEWAHL